MMATLKGEMARAYAKLRPYGFFLVIVLMNVGLGRLLWGCVMYVGEWYLQITRLVSRIFV